MGTIKSFTDLDAWKEGHKLLLEIYQLTRKFPADEKFCFVDQMRRCSLSITSNIAEGFSRKSYKEKSQFYYIALGSITELQNQLLASRDLGYISKQSFQEIARRTVVVNKLINGIIKSAKILNT
ncbi:MAG TPA: four helix bundle protein [Patescibacteria group bacterium]|nr:four helix bundle protein [Patescibacteria group bacterium]